MRSEAYGNGPGLLGSSRLRQTHPRLCVPARLLPQLYQLHPSLKMPCWLSCDNLTKQQSMCYNSNEKYFSQQTLKEMFQALYTDFRYIKKKKKSAETINGFLSLLNSGYSNYNNPVILKTFCFYSFYDCKLNIFNKTCYLKTSHSTLWNHDGPFKKYIYFLTFYETIASSVTTITVSCSRN